MLLNYLKTALAVLARRKFFTFVSLFGITFTLTVVLVAAALLDHIFGPVPPEVHQDRTLGLYRVTLTQEKGEGRGITTALAGYALLDRYARDLPGAEKAGICSIPSKAVSYVGGQRVESFLKHTDAAFWEILQFDFLEGRPFTADEVQGAAPVAVVNQATRERFFGHGPALGEMVEADGTRYRVVGVVSNVSFLRLVPFADIWVPISTRSGFDASPDLIGFYMGVILARSRADLPRIREEFLSRMASADLSMHRSYDRITAVPETTFDMVARLAFSQGRSSTDQSARLMVWLTAFAVLFMVLPTINLVNLNLSRILERSSEIGVRKAFGAPALTLVGQFLVENVLLTLLGGVLALALTTLALELIAFAGWIPYARFHLSLRVFGFALAATLFFGLLSGVYPAWRMSRLSPVDALRGGLS